MSIQSSRPTGDETSRLCLPLLPHGFKVSKYLGYSFRLSNRNKCKITQYEDSLKARSHPRFFIMSLAIWLLCVIASASLVGSGALMALRFLIGKQGGFTAISYRFPLDFYWIQGFAWILGGFTGS